jgi:hypothetical protein
MYASTTTLSKSIGGERKRGLKISCVVEIERLGDLGS